MPGVGSSLLHPLCEDLPFGIGQLLLGILGRHGIFLVVKPREDFTLGGIVGIDSVIAAAVSGGILVGIETELFLFLGVRSVADEALVGENGEHLAGEVDLLAEGGRGGGEDEGGEQ